MKWKNFILATLIAGASLIPASMGFAAHRQWNSVECNQFLETPEIRSQEATLKYYLARRTLEADLAADGFNIITGDSYQINNTSVLNATTLGSGVIASSLTSLGTITTLAVTTANVTTLNVSGVASFNGGQTRKHVIFPETVALDGSNPPSLATLTGGTGNTAEVLQFDADGGATGDDHCYFVWHVPDGYVTDSARINLMWSCESAETASDTATFDLAVLSVASGEAWDASMTAGAAVIDTQWAGTADQVFTTQLTPEVLTIAVDDMLYVDIFVDESGSTYGDTIDIHQFEIEYESTE